MLFLYITIFALTTVASIAIFNIKFEDVLLLFKSKKKQKTFYDYIAIYKPELQKKKGKIRQELADIKNVLELTGQSDKFDAVKTATIVFAIAGAIIAILFKNYAAIPFVALFLALIPIVYIKRVTNRYEKSVDESIEATLSIITNSYLRTESIVSAVKENLDYVQEPLKTHFKTFVVETEIINPNVTIALNNLKYKVANPVFFDWCNRVIQCQSDRMLKTTLLPIIERMSDLRTVRAELMADLVAPRNEAIMMALLVLSNIPLLYLMNKDWGAVLFQTLQGKIALSMVFTILLLCGIRIWRLCQPLKYEEMEDR